MAEGVVSLIIHQDGKKGVSIPSGHVKPHHYIKKNRNDEVQKTQNLGTQTQ